MPWQAPRPCTYPGCPNFAEVHGRCREHKRADDRALSIQRRQDPNDVGWFYSTARWKRLRNRFRKANPLCEACKAKGITQAMDIVDHITPILDGGAPYDWSNLQSLCTPCHNSKSNKERAARKRKREE